LIESKVASALSPTLLQKIFSQLAGGEAVEAQTPPDCLDSRHLVARRNHADSAESDPELTAHISLSLMSS
jgi:hypothetical protein